MHNFVHLTGSREISYLLLTVAKHSRPPRHHELRQKGVNVHSQRSAINIPRFTLLVCLKLIIDCLFILDAVASTQAILIWISRPSKWRYHKLACDCVSMIKKYSLSVFSENKLKTVHIRCFESLLFEHG